MKLVAIVLLGIAVLLPAAASAQSLLCRFASRLDICQEPPSVPFPPLSPERQAPVASQPAPKAVVQPQKATPAPRKAKARHAPPKQEQAPLAGGGQALPPTVACKPIAVNCSQVCEHAWMGAAAAEALGVAWGYCRPTPTQRAQGKECVRRQCPRYLTP